MELSVIMPVYNAAKLLPVTLASLLAQHPLPFPWEIVAVDDGSTDDSLLVLKEYAKKARELGIRFRVEARENGGVGSCRNRCLDLAEGKRILFLDADDRLHDGALAYGMKRMDETGADLFLFDSEFLYADGRREPFSMSEHEGGAMTAEDYMLSQPCPWNKIVARSVFEESGLSFPEGILYEDLAMIPLLGAFAKGGIWYEKKCLHSYYQSSNSIMRSPWSEKRMDLFPALEFLYSHGKGNEDGVAYLFFLHLYRSFVWQAWEAGDRKALCRASSFMKAHFPKWWKNPLIRRKTRGKERMTAILFHHKLFWLLSAWKGGKG